MKEKILKKFARELKNDYGAIPEYCIEEFERRLDTGFDYNIVYKARAILSLPYGELNDCPIAIKNTIHWLENLKSFWELHDGDKFDTGEEIGVKIDAVTALFCDGERHISPQTLVSYIN